jgi:hypothetical protein
LTEQAASLASELATTPVAVPTRCIADDCTPEKLAALLRDQGGRIAVLSPEGDVFDLMAGRYSSNGTANLGVYLKGHAGDTLRVDRMGRTPEFVKEPALTVGLAVQPEVIRGLATKPGFRGRGLLARFLFSLPTSQLGYRDTNPPPVPDEVYEVYRGGLLVLLNLPNQKGEDVDLIPHVLTIEPVGQYRLQKFETWVEPQLSEFGQLGRMTDWGGKLVGAVARIAGLLHMAEHAGADAPWELPVSEATVEHAIRVGMYLIPHAKAAFAEMGPDETVERAKAILRWISHNHLDSFSRRDVHQGMRAMFKRVTELDSPLAVLVERGFIRRRPERPNAGSGRPASPTFDVNPRWVLKDAGFTGGDEYILRGMLKTWGTRSTGEILDYAYFQTAPMEAGIRNSLLDFSVIQPEGPTAYSRSSSGKTKAEIQKLRTKFEAGQAQRKTAQNQPFAFTPPKYDEEYFDAMAKLETA